MPPHSTLPDAEQLVAELAGKLRPALTPNTGLVGILTGGAWIAEKRSGTGLKCSPRAERFSKFPVQFPDRRESSGGGSR